MFAHPPNAQLPTQEAMEAPERERLQKEAEELGSTTQVGNTL